MTDEAQFNMSKSGSGGIKSRELGGRALKNITKWLGRTIGVLGKKTTSGIESATGAAKYREKALQVNTELEHSFSLLGNALEDQRRRSDAMSKDAEMFKQRIGDLSSENIRLQKTIDELNQRIQGQHISLPAVDPKPARILIEEVIVAPVLEKRKWWRRRKNTSS
jgi:hypothetical protein